MDAAGPVTPGRDAHATERLIEDNLQLAHWFTHHVGGGRNPGESYDEVLADSMLGLWDAAKRWDPARGSFYTFAHRRILGAIADGRRQRDPLSRSQRNRGTARPLSLDAIRLFSSELTLADVLADPNDDMTAMLDQAEDAERRAWFWAQVDQLPARKRRVIEVLVAGGTLADAAAELGVTESRACQIKFEVIHKLRERLAA